MVKRINYIEIGQELNVGTAYLQASNALDVAASLAQENRDIPGLLEVAKCYIALGERLGDHDDPDAKDFEFGFQCESAVSTETIEPDHTHLEDGEEE